MNKFSLFLLLLSMTIIGCQSPTISCDDCEKFKYEMFPKKATEYFIAFGDSKDACAQIIEILNTANIDKKVMKAIGDEEICFYDKNGEKLLKIRKIGEIFRYKGKYYRLSEINNHKFMNLMKSMTIEESIGNPPTWNDTTNSQNIPFYKELNDLKENNTSQHDV